MKAHLLFIYLHYNTVYTHPTSSGNKHIPSGGSAGQILRWSSDGTAVWGSDNNTTYSTGTSSASGLTKLYGGTGSATDGTMTQSAITSALNGKAASSHTHTTLQISNRTVTFNWNGQGGQPNWLWGGNDSDPTQMYVYNPNNFWVSHANKSSTLDVTFNPISSNNLDTPLNFAQHGVSANFITALKQVTDQPCQYGMLLTVGSSGSDCHQIWMSQPNGSVYHRGGNSSGWSGTWYRLLSSNEPLETNHASDVANPGYDDATIRFNGGTTPFYILKNSGGISIHPYKGSRIFQWTVGSTLINSKLYAQGVYDLSSSSTANMHITGDGSVRRIGSASKYKLDIKPLEEDASYPYKLLNLQPKQWFDKGDTERYAELLSKEYSGEEIDEEFKRVAEGGSLDSYYGLIAEDLESAGLNKFCTYGKEDKNGKKEVEGVMYDRIPILMIPILKDLVEYVKTTYPLIKDSIKDKDSLSKVSSIIDRMNSINDSTMVNTTYKVDNTEK